VTFQSDNKIMLIIAPHPPPPFPPLDFSRLCVSQVTGLRDNSDSGRHTTSGFLFYWILQQFELWQVRSSASCSNFQYPLVSSRSSSSSLHLLPRLTATRFGRGYRPVVRQTTECMDGWMDEWTLKPHDILKAKSALVKTVYDVRECTICSLVFTCFCIECEHS
jgi:hypothetical protein